MTNYNSNELDGNYFKLDNSFIIDHLDDLIELVDYVPFSFVEFGAQDKRDDFLRSKNLLSTMQEMDQLITAKIEYYEDSVKAWNSLIIEWLDCHPEFEGIISEEFVIDYQNMKNSDEFLNFTTFLYFVELPSEKKVWVPSKGNTYLRDDSSIQLPNFKEKDNIFEKYGASLLSCYLAYLG